MTSNLSRGVITGCCGLLIAVVASTAVSADTGQPVAVQKAQKLTVGKIYLVIMTTGKVQSGTLTKTTKTAITLTPANGKAVEIPRDKIETIRETATKSTAISSPVVIRKPAILVKQNAKVIPIVKVKVVPAVKPKEPVKVRVVRQPLIRSQSRIIYPVRDTVDANDPKERLLVLTPRGPFVMELAIYLDGKPFRTAAETLIDEQLKHADTNKDGKATWEEAFANPRFSMQPYRYVINNPATIKAFVRQYDLNQDGIVDRYELRALLASTNRGATFTVSPDYSLNRTPDIMPLLDTNKDGVLSADELAAAADRLKSRDADDNDLLDFTEVGIATGQTMRRGVRLPTQPRDVHLLGPTASLTTIFSALQSRYANGEKSLPAGIFRAAPELVKSLDLNKKGRIEAGEMIGLHLADPQLKLEIRIGSKDDQGIGVHLLHVAKGFNATVTDPKTPGDRRTVSLPGWKLITSAVKTVPQTNTTGQRTADSYLARYDTDKNGYLTEEELKKQGVTASFILRYFSTWDEDGDGKVFRKEIIAYYDRQSQPRRCRVLGFTNSNGPSLFAALDVSGDNRLSLREMRQAGQRLKSLDRNRNGRIEADELQSETQLSFRQDGLTNYAVNRIGTTTNGSGTAGPRRGPKWFVHMDKNGDGDVTLREFLGTKSQFEKLDANKDGFIEQAEAEAARK